MKNRMFKLGAFTLVLLLLLSTAIGCSKSSDVSQPADEENGESVQSEDVEQQEEAAPEEETYDFGGRTIKYATWWDAEPKEGSSEAADKTLARISALEEKFNCTFEYAQIPMDQYLEKFTSSTLAGDPWADILEMHVMWFYPGLVSQGFLSSLDDLGVFDFSQEKWNEAVMKYGTYQGKTYGMSTGKTGPSFGVFWNKTMFERENLPNLYEIQEEKQWTWDQLRDIAVKVTKDLDGDGKIDQWGLDGLDVTASFVASNSAAVVDIVDDKPVFGLNSPNAIEALQEYQNLITQDRVYLQTPEGSQWDYGITQFELGKTAMLVAQWWVSGMLKDNMADDYGYVFFPMGPKADEYTSSFSGFNLTVMSSTLNKPEEAALWWNAMTEPFPDDQPDDWKASYEDGARDRETIDETIVPMVENGMFTLNMLESFPELQNMTWGLYYEISSGNKTAKVAVEEVAQAAQAILNDSMKEN